MFLNDIKTRTVINQSIPSFSLSLSHTHRHTCMHTHTHTHRYTSTPHVILECGTSTIHDKESAYMMSTSLFFYVEAIPLLRLKTDSIV